MNFFKKNPKKFNVNCFNTLIGSGVTLVGDILAKKGNIVIDDKGSLQGNIIFEEDITFCTDVSSIIVKNGGSITKCKSLESQFIYINGDVVVDELRF